jgi:serine/threonine protein kinase
MMHLARHSDVPFRVGPYAIERFLGAGSMANVYAARHTENGRLAAVKVLHPHLIRDRIATARLLREARALSRISHPNVVKVFDVGDNDAPYFAMELIDGEDLTQYLRRLQPMSVGQIAGCMLPVVDAIAAAHAARVVHRDLKPSNILFTRDGRGSLVPKVLDFGISKPQEDRSISGLTETGAALGTVSYMSPEQLRSAKRVDARSDIYALGVLLYECATGQRPFHGESTYDLMHAILTAHLAPPSFLRPNIPPDFDALVLRAMAREPARRFASVYELRRALAAFCPDGSERLVEPGVLRTAQERMPGGNGERPTLLFKIRRRVVVFVNHSESPTDEEWDAYLSVGYRAAQCGAPRILAITEGGPPSAMQRKRAARVAAEICCRSAVVTDDYVARTIVTAFAWLGEDIKAFRRREIDNA